MAHTVSSAGKEQAGGLLGYGDIFFLTLSNASACPMGPLWSAPVQAQEPSGPGRGLGYAEVCSSIPDPLPGLSHPFLLSLSCYIPSTPYLWNTFLRLPPPSLVPLYSPSLAAWVHPVQPSPLGQLTRVITNKLYSTFATFYDNAAVAELLEDLNRIALSMSVVYS